LFNNPQCAATVLDGRNRVDYRGQTYSISGLALKLWQEFGTKRTTTNCFIDFYHNNATLFSLRPDMRKEEQ
jgi:hypothetical protein